MFCPSPAKWILISALHLILIQECFHVFGQYAGGRGVFRGTPNRGYPSIKTHPCEKSSCYPATGNLLIGRENQLYSSSTCGLHGRQRYCIVSHLEERKKCFWCDSTPTRKPNPHYNHNISNIVYRMYPGTRNISWWQSENGKEKVYIQLDLEAEFHFTHLIITFKTFRPAAMLIERSYDSGKNWQVYRYFAHNCRDSFPHAREGYPENLTDVVCESRYSNVAPGTGGEVIYRVLPPTLHIDNPYSDQVQNLLKMTNLRINFTKLHTLGDDLLDKRGEIQEKYYYAISDMVVRGSCSCYGHANRCLPLPGIEPKPDMVHGRCECTHNTKGRNCEKCEDFFNDLPWQPAIGKETNACQRCNCNNHATICHFDRALYEHSGHISGGICDGCAHNTMGANCELCKEFYYRDPNRELSDPEVCRPCDCDPDGSLDGGICDSATDTNHGLVAGSCHCKANVEGRRCDSCKNGYWNFTLSNPDGCQPCTCNILGTVNNQGCNVKSGECTCKRYVTEHNCDQCLPEYWGLSEQQDGCQPCQCDPGGAFDNFCDVISGKCLCRDHMSGRTCDTPKQQYFIPSLDFFLYEAELARGSGNSQVVIREPHRDGRPDPWTGTGYDQTYEGAILEFIVNDIRASLDYDIVVRYETINHETWENAIMTIRRPGPVDPDGPCAKSYAEDDIKQLSLPGNSRSVTAFPPACLEAGRTYHVFLEMKRSSYQRENPSASVLIDSIVLVPRFEKLPIFSGSAAAEERNREFQRNRCGDPAYLIHGAQIPEVCKKFYDMIGAYVGNGSLPCNCDQTGSTSKICARAGGACTCKPNVVGRRCDRCATGTYGFGPEGCKACDCNSIGALDNFCNSTTGQCKCRPNTYGRQCDQCQPGFWNFPNCQRCDCNGHADTCDPRTGACQNCRDYTQGHRCEFCTDSYYGDPRLNADIPCRPCPCPGTAESGHSYASRCSLDPYTKDVFCQCNEGYSGSRCDVCSDNFYGNPEVPGGSCLPCDCNNKVDLLKPGNCDPHTGKCLQCLYDTTGDHCEVCSPDFFRYAEDQPCRRCVCHILGTNATAGVCDPYSGQCKCLPNVDGTKCDQCIKNHWKIASGKGCEPCDCDPQGSSDTQCNEFDGQCPCLAGFGGRQCNECVADYWGDPKQQCNVCDCDQRGIRTLQCDRKTGACVCLSGIGGYRCDTCARGYIGTAPNCSPCGECFDNWDRILQEAKNETTDIINRAGDIKKVGATGAYTKEFDEMQSQLDEIQRLLNSTAKIDTDQIKKELEALRIQLNKTEFDQLSKLDDSLADTKEKTLLYNLTLTNLKKSIDDLMDEITELKNNGTQLQEANVQGALTLIVQAKEKADEAVQKANNIESIVSYAERQCQSTEHYINITSKTFSEQLEKNKEALEEMKKKLGELEDAIPELNDLVCDGKGDPCDMICGGVGCGHCGDSISCKDGAKQLAETALNVANNSDTAIREKEATANEFIRAVSQINTNETKNIAQATNDKALLTLKKSNRTLTDYNNLLFEMQEFLSQNNTKPEDIKKLAEEVLAMRIHSDDEEIEDLAHKIKSTVDLLTNTDPIIEATRNDINKVNLLKEKAENLKGNATDLLNHAEEVNKQLEATTDAQTEAENAINKALNDVDEVNILLYQIGNVTNDAQEKTGNTHGHIERLKEQINELQRNITDNGIFANRVMNESATIKMNSQKTQGNFNNLKSKYEQVKIDLNRNIARVKTSKERADNLLTRAVELVSKVTNTQQEIIKLSSETQDITLDDMENTLSDLINQMNKYTKLIEDRLDYYKRCN